MPNSMISNRTIITILHGSPRYNNELNVLVQVAAKTFIIDSHRIYGSMWLNVTVLSMNNGNRPINITVKLLIC